MGKSVLKILGKLTLSLTVAGVFAVMLEGLASMAYASRNARLPQGITEKSHCEYDPDLGWMNLPDYHAENLYGKGVSYTTNLQRFRATRDYTAMVPEGFYRAICLGDSFTMGFGVGDNDTYPAQLESISEDMEVVNMGLGAFGIDQDYLWYKRDGAKLDTDLLLFAFIADDFDRMTQKEFTHYPKPVLSLEDGKLVLGNVPLPRVWGTTPRFARMHAFFEHLALKRLLPGKRSPQRHWARPNEEQVLPFTEVAEFIFEDLGRLSRERGQDFALVYLPVNTLLEREPLPVVEWLEDFSVRAGIVFINLTEDFGKLPPWEIRRCFRPGDGHYSVYGNRVVAEALQQKLQANFPTYPR